MKALAVLLLLIAAAPGRAVDVASGGAPAPAPDPAGKPVPSPESVLDHFLCYRTASDRFRGPVVTLEDQFGRAGTSALKRLFVCNPVDKYPEGLPASKAARRDSHLVCYGLPGDKSQSAGRYRISNQLSESEEVEVLESHMLCLPSGKTKKLTETPPVPEDLDHFKCYVTASRDAGPLKVRLADQFLDRTAQVRRQPVMLCNPTRKERGNGETVPVRHAFAHLGCYLAQFEGAFSPQKVRIANQFEPKGATVTATRPELLCIPSTKEKVEKPASKNP